MRVIASHQKLFLVPLHLTLPRVLAKLAPLSLGEDCRAKRRSASVSAAHPLGGLEQQARLFSALSSSRNKGQVAYCGRNRDGMKMHVSGKLSAPTLMLAASISLPLEQHPPAELT